LAEFHACPNEGLRVDERQEFRPTGDQRSAQPLLESGHTQSDKIKRVRRWLVASEGMHRGEAPKLGERVGIVVQETGYSPSMAAIRMLASPSVKFPSETAGTDDEQFFH
jgi:hypothetical protein